MIDNNLFNCAQYRIMVATNSVTDEVRNTYFSAICSDRIKCADAFNSILISIFKGIDDNIIDSETAKKLIATEYNKSCLHEIFGDYSPFSVLIDNIVDAKTSGKEVYTIDEFKKYINIADTLAEDFAISIYYIILSKMCLTGTILEDIEFSKKLMNYVNNSTMFDNKFLYDALSYIFLNNINY